MEYEISLFFLFGRLSAHSKKIILILAKKELSLKNAGKRNSKSYSEL